jgi:iron complex outermembrane recepter protein
VLAQQSVNENSLQAEEIVVTGIRGSLSRARDIKRDADSIMDVISAEDIGQFPDANVAESLQRITGVTITRFRGQGQQITVRGMGPEYNAVSFNGRSLANDNRGREFNFDLIAAELISGAEVIKSPTASLQEGSIGASVNIKTARPLSLDEFTLVGSIKADYNDLSEDTSPKVSGLISQTFFDGTLGALASFAYTKEYHRLDELGTGWSNVDTTGDGNNDAWARRGMWPKVIMGDRERLGGTFALEFQPSDQWHVVLDGLYSSYGADEYRQGQGIGFDLDDGTLTPDQQSVVDSNGNVVSSITQGKIVEITRELWPRYTDTLQVGLNVEFSPSDDFTLTADVSYSEADQDGRDDGGFFSAIGYEDPQVSYDGSTVTPNLSITNDPYDASLYKANFAKMYADKILDKLYDFKLDGSWRAYKGVLASVNAGIAFTSRDKKLNFFGSFNPCAFCGFEQDIPDDILGTAVVDDYLNAESNSVVDSFPTFDDKKLFAYLEGLSPGDYLPMVEYANESSVVKEKTFAGYLQGNFEGTVSDMEWSGNVGVRVVTTNQISEGVTTTILDIGNFGDKNVKTENVPAAFNNNYTDVLPSANFKLDIQDDLTLRLGAAKVMTRPTLTKLSTAVFIDARGGVDNPNTIGRANPFLDPYRATQFDTSLEWYPAPETALILAYFYKDLESFVSDVTRQVTIKGLDFDETKPENGNSAKVEGWEVGVTHSFTRLPSPFDGLGIQANYTLSDSEAHFDDSISSDNFKLQGLSDDSYNFILFYDKGPLQARIAYNYRSEYQNSAIGTGGEPQYVDESARVDFSASYALNDKLTLTFEGANLTNEEVYRYQRIESRMTGLEYNGREYVFGIRASF